jgi:hypothetical protein
VVAHFYQISEHGKLQSSLFLVHHARFPTDHDLQTRKFIHDVNKHEALSNNSLGSNPAIDVDNFGAVKAFPESLMKVRYRHSLGAMQKARMCLRKEGILALFLRLKLGSAFLLERGISFHLILAPSRRSG